MPIPELLRRIDEDPLQPSREAKGAAFSVSEQVRVIPC
jgi:hypothetical protein